MNEVEYHACGEPVAGDTIVGCVRPLDECNGQHSRKIGESARVRAVNGYRREKARALAFDEIIEQRMREMEQTL